MKRVVGYSQKNAIALVVSLTLVGSASAEEPTGPVEAGSALQEIVVTAQKREQNLQDVGISVTAFSAKQIEDMGAMTTTDLTKQVPNFRFIQTSPGSVDFSIRGVSQNDFADHLEGPIAAYLDDSYQGESTAIGGQVFDLERVEVLRGPQGTLFGRNATGGLVQYISKAPTNEFEAYGSATFGRFDQRVFEGAVGGPISDSIRARLSVASNYNDNWGHNVVGGPDTGETSNWSMRLQVIADLSASTQLHLTFRGGANGNEGQGVTGTTPAYSPPGATGLGYYLPPNVNAYGTCPGCNLLGNKGNGYNANDIRVKAPGILNRDDVGATAKLTSDFSFAQFTSVTDFIYVHKDFLRTDVDMNPQPLFDYTTTTQYHQYSQEFRLNGTVDRVNWIAGLYYLHMSGHYGTKVNFDPSFTVGLPTGTLATSTENNYTITTKSWSGFAQGDYALTDSLSATLGARFTSDKKEDDFVWFGNYPGAGPAFNFAYNPALNPSAERTFNMVSAKAEMDWHFAKDKLLYFSFSRGVKGGNWAAPVFPGPTPATAAALPHNPETLYDYEVGVKTMWLDDKVRFNAGVFYYDYKNYQAFGLVNLLQAIENDNAREAGGEMELSVIPLRGLTLTAGLATLDSTVFDHTLPDGATKKDRILPMAPKFSGTASARYEWPILGRTASLSAFYAYTGQEYFDVNNAPVTSLGGHGVTDLRASLQSADKRWETSLWVNNVTNKIYSNYLEDISALSLANYALANPRWYGVTVRVHY